MPTAGTNSVAFGGDNGNGQDFYVTVANRILDFSTGRITSYHNPGTAMYKVKGIGRGMNFKRYKAY